MSTEEITSATLESMNNQLQKQASEKGIKLNPKGTKRSRTNSMADDNSGSQPLDELINLQNDLQNMEFGQAQGSLESMIVKLLSYLINNVSPKLEENLRISKEAVQGIETVKNDLETLQGEVSDLKKEVLNNQIQESAKSVIIRELPPLKTSGRETPFDIKTQVENMLTEIGIKDETKITDVYRLRGGKTDEYAGRGVFLPVKVTFSSKFDIGLVFKNLKHLKDFKSIKVARDYPRLLLADFKKLDRVAWKIRQDLPGSKTNIRIKNSKLVLFVKKSNEPHFQEAEIV